MSQHETATGYHLRLTSLGLSVLIVTGLFLTIIACRRRSSTVVESATLTATFLFIAGCYTTITARHGPLLVAVAYDVLVKLQLLVLCAWLVRRTVRGRGLPTALPRWLPKAFAAGVVLLVPWFVAVLFVIQRTTQQHNLGVFWTGLDLCELAGLALTAWFVFRRSPSVAVSASATATLLFSDAWVNIVTTDGLAHRASLVMSLVELPLAFYAVAIARREVRGWSAAPLPDAPAGQPTALGR